MDKIDAFWRMNDELMIAADPGLHLLDMDSDRWTLANGERRAGIKSSPRSRYRGYGETPIKLETIIVNMLRNTSGRHVGSLKARGNTARFRALTPEQREEDLDDRLVNVGKKLGIVVGERN